MASVPTSRFITSQDQLAGPGSVTNRTARILLRSIDYSVVKGTSEWSDPDACRATVEQLTADYDMLYCLPHAVGGEILRYDGKGLIKFMDNFIRRHGLASLSRTLFRTKGSEVIAVSKLRRMHYDRDKEMERLRVLANTERPTSKQPSSNDSSAPVRQPFEDHDNVRPPPPAAIIDIHAARLLRAAVHHVETFHKGKGISGLALGEELCAKYELLKYSPRNRQLFSPSPERVRQIIYNELLKNGKPHVAMKAFTEKGKVALGSERLESIAYGQELPPLREQNCVEPDTPISSGTTAEWRHHSQAKSHLKQNGEPAGRSEPFFGQSQDQGSSSPLRPSLEPPQQLTTDHDCVDVPEADDRIAPTIRAVVHHIEEHYKGTGIQVTGKQIGREVWERYETFYVDRMSNQLIPRRPQDVVEAVLSFLSVRYGPPIFLADLVAKGSGALDNCRLRSIDLDGPLPPLRLRGENAAQATTPHSRFEELTKAGEESEDSHQTPSPGRTMSPAEEVSTVISHDDKHLKRDAFAHCTLRAVIHYIDEYCKPTGLQLTANELGVRIADRYDLSYRNSDDQLVRLMPEQVRQALFNFLRAKNGREAIPISKAVSEGSACMTERMLASIGWGGTLPPRRPSESTMPQNTSHRTTLPMSSGMIDDSDTGSVATTSSAEIVKPYPRAKLPFYPQLGEPSSGAGPHRRYGAQMPIASSGLDNPVSRGRKRAAGEVVAPVEQKKRHTSGAARICTLRPATLSTSNDLRISRESSTSLPNVPGTGQADLTIHDTPHHVPSADMDHRRSVDVGQSDNPRATLRSQPAPAAGDQMDRQTRIASRSGIMHQRPSADLARISVPRTSIASHVTSNSGGRKSFAPVQVFDNLAQSASTGIRRHNPILADSTNFCLDHDRIKGFMQNIFSRSKSTAHQQLSSCGLDPDSLVSIPQGRGPEFNELYDLILGQGKSGFEIMSPALDVTSFQWLTALMGAFLHRWIFGAAPMFSLASFGAHQKAALGALGEAYEIELRELGTTSDTLYRHVALRHIQKSFVRNEDVAKVGVELAAGLASVLQRHVQLQGAFGEMQISSQLDEIVKLALVLRCELSIAREEYSFLWPAIGDAYEARAMESMNGPGDVVVVGMFPGVHVMRNGEREVAAEGQVLLASSTE